MDARRARRPGDAAERGRRGGASVSDETTCFHNLKAGGILRELAPGLMARIFPGVNVMLSVVTIEPGSVSPVHAHPNEQWGVCLEGEWIRIQDGVEHHVRAGDFWQTPPNVPHGGRALATRAVVLDIFAPPREEYRRTGKGMGTALA
jgi:quercetin dioxygenase-like cupin family protein